MAPFSPEGENGNLCQLDAWPLQQITRQIKEVLINKISWIE